MKKLFPVFLVFSLLPLFFLQPVYAQSSYVLPYPSQMPGNKFYKINLVIEKLSYFWYFGNFGKSYYYQRLSDKYLVEAKTLFEYKQYLLGYKALLKSDFYFLNTLPNLLNAKKENKNISNRRLILREASLKHIEVLRKIEQEVPENFLWIPEKGPSTKLRLKRSIEGSISIREKYL